MNLDSVCSNCMFFIVVNFQCDVHHTQWPISCGCWDICYHSSIHIHAFTHLTVLSWFFLVYVTCLLSWLKCLKHLCTVTVHWLNIEQNGSNNTLWNCSLGGYLDVEQVVWLAEQPVMIRPVVDVGQGARHWSSQPDSQPGESELWVSCCFKQRSPHWPPLTSTPASSTIPVSLRRVFLSACVCVCLPWKWRSHLSETALLLGLSSLNNAVANRVFRWGGTCKDNDVHSHSLCTVCSEWPGEIKSDQTIAVDQLA